MLLEDDRREKEVHGSEKNDYMKDEKRKFQIIPLSLISFYFLIVFMEFNLGYFWMSNDFVLRILQ